MSDPAPVTPPTAAATPAAPAVAPTAPAPVPGPANGGPPAGAAPTVDNDPTHTPLLGSLLHVPLKKIGIWAGIALLLYILRDFFPLIFLTFVLSYISSSVVAKIEHRFSARWIPVTMFFLALVGLLVSFGVVTVPRIQRQARDLRTQIQAVGSWNRYVDEKLRATLGNETYESWAEDLGEPMDPPKSLGHIIGGPNGAQGIAPVGSKSLSKGLVHMDDAKRKQAVGVLVDIGKVIWKGVAFLFMSVIFSYLFVLSLPTFERGLDQLERSRLADVYHEVGPSIGIFTRLVGRALEAQTFIALANTVITAIGMWFLGIPQIGLLSVGVFVCSFIPVAGVFISTAPIAFAGLLMEGGGPGKLIGVVVMVTVAHIVEAYVLNPKIYGHHMKMNPLAVLFILVIAEHTVGVWGLVIAVPFITYVWKHLILNEAEAKH